MYLDYLASQQQMNDRLRDAEQERLIREFRQANKQIFYQKVSNWLSTFTIKQINRHPGKLSYEA